MGHMLLQSIPSFS
jgi:hypothetical protein